jgi:hypothetical protein
MEDLLFHMADLAVVRAANDAKWLTYHKRLQALISNYEHKGWKVTQGKTQYDLILNHMRKQGSISQREAMMDYSIQSFHKRISELREAGFDIQGFIKRHPVTGQQYTRYYLLESFQVSA